jgi:hypothetical protein
MTLFETLLIGLVAFHIMSNEDSNMPESFRFVIFVTSMLSFMAGVGLLIHLLAEIL